MKSIFKSVAILTVFSVLTRLMGFFLRIYLSRVVGSEALGLYQVALSVFMVLLTIVTSGLTLIVSRMTAGYRVTKDNKKTNSLATTALLVSLSLSVILCVVVFLFRGTFSKIFTDENCINVLIIMLPSLIFSSIYSTFRGVMWGKDNYFALSITEFFEEIAKLIFCVILVGGGMSAIQGAMKVATSFTLSCVLSAIFVVILYFVYGGRIGKPTKVYKSLIRQAYPITAMRVVGSLIQPLIALVLPAKLLLAGYTASQSMSIFGVALGMTYPLLSLPATLIGSLSTALIPDISMALIQNNSEHIQKRVTSSMNFALFITFLIFPVYVAMGNLIGEFLYDNTLSGVLLEYSAWIMIPMGITNISSAVLNSVGLEKRSFVNYIIGGVFTFLSIIFLTKYMGVLSLSFGMGITSFVSGFLNLLMLKRKLKIEVGVLKRLSFMFLLSLPTIAIGAFLASILKHFIPTFFVLAISASITIVFYVLLCMVFNMINIQGFVVEINKKFKERKSKHKKVVS